MGTMIIRFTDAESDLIKQAAKQDYRSISQWCKLTLLRHIENSAPKPDENAVTQQGL